MSGSGGGGDPGDWRPRTQVAGDVGGGDDKCAIVERTILNSPVAAVIAGLKVGDLLKIELEVTARKRVVAKNQAGAIAGAITSAKLVDLIECIEAGNSYEGQVLAVQGGRVEIEIHRA